MTNFISQMLDTKIIEDQKIVETQDLLTHKTNRHMMMEQIIIDTATSGLTRSNRDRSLAPDNIALYSHSLKYPYVQQNFTSVSQNITFLTQS